MSKTTTLSITGMHCEACEKLIAMELEEMDGIDTAEVDHKTGKAVIHGDGPVDIEQIKPIISKLGYSVDQ